MNTTPVTSGPTSSSFRKRHRNASKDQKKQNGDPRALTANKDYSLGEFGCALDLYNTNSPDRKMDGDGEKQVPIDFRYHWYRQEGASMQPSGHDSHEGSGRALNPGISDTNKRNELGRKGSASMQHSGLDSHGGSGKAMNSGISDTKRNELGRTGSALLPTPPGISDTKRNELGHKGSALLPTPPSTATATQPDPDIPSPEQVLKAIKTSVLTLQRNRIRKEMLVTLSDLQKHVLDIFEIDDEDARSKFMGIMSGTFCALSLEKESSTSDNRERLATKLREMIGNISDVLGTISAEPPTFASPSTSPASGAQAQNSSPPFWTMRPPPLPADPKMVKIEASKKKDGNQGGQHVQTPTRGNRVTPEPQQRLLPPSHAIRKATNYRHYMVQREFHPHYFRSFRGHGHSSGHKQVRYSYGQRFSPFDQDDRAEFERFVPQYGAGRKGQNRNSSSQITKAVQVFGPSRNAKSEPK